jgi:hypothetical protein
MDTIFNRIPQFRIAKQRPGDIYDVTRPSRNVIQMLAGK